MQHRILRTAIAVVLIASAALVALTLAPSTTGPAGAASAVAAGEYSTPGWLPLRGSVAIGCAANSPGPYCNGHHGYNALDMGGYRGQPVYAAGKGVATVYDTNRGCSGYGVTVKVDHGAYGTSIYAHLDGIAPAVAGAGGGGIWVDENSVIGYVGHTGSVSGCNLDHLHFEHWSGQPHQSTRLPTPDLKGCAGGALRTYPDHFGYDNWIGFPGHSFTAVNDGTGCLGGPIGYLDQAVGTLGGFAEVSGWTLDNDQRATSTEVQVYIDGPAGSGATPTTLLANRARPDVAWAFAGAGENHGYHGAIGGLSPGAHTVFVYAVNLAGTPGTNTLIGSSSISVPAAPSGMPFGSVDGATGLVWGQASIGGWVADPDVPTASTQVQVYIDGPAGSGAPSVVIDANRSRPDVANVYPTLGPWHGFDAIIGDIVPGVRMLWFYALNAAGPAGNPLIGVRTVTVIGDPSACAPESTAGPFTDVPPDHTFCRDIEWMHTGAIDVGNPNHTYAPLSPNTRAMMADQLYNVAGKPAFVPPDQSPFSDVALDHPRYLQITWLAAMGVTAGFEDGTFRPGSSVSRQSMAAFFYRLAGSPVVTPTATFTDVPIGHLFDDEITWLSQTGVTGGYGDDTYRPEAQVTRQSMAAFVHRYATIQA